MRKVILVAFASVVAVSLSMAETTQTKASAQHKHTVSKTGARTSKSTASKRGASKSSTAATSAKARSKAAKGKPVRKAARSYQQAPTQERYLEIQQALAKKGYFQGEASGKWGPDSTDALKRFQAEQNLTPDGKINSLSLIALGLGPKRLTAQSKSAAPPSPPPASQ